MAPALGASSTSPYYFLRNAANPGSKLCLNQTGEPASYHLLKLYPDSVPPDGTCYFTLRALGNSKFATCTVLDGDVCLDVFGNEDKVVHLAPKVDGQYPSGQYWTATRWSDGSLRLTNGYTPTTYHLDTNSGSGQAFMGSGDDLEQHWRFVSPSNKDFEATASGGDGTDLSSVVPRSDLAAPTTTSVPTTAIDSGGATATSTPTSQIDGDQGLSEVARAGIVLGVGGPVLLILFLLVFWWGRRRPSGNGTEEEEDEEPVSRKV